MVEIVSMKKIFSFLIYSFYAVILVGLAVLFFKPSVLGLNAFEVKIVKSGSMEPTIMTGAVVVVQPAPVYKVGEVVTFSSKDSVIPTTHRLIGVEDVEGKKYFVTKGDANEEQDANLLLADDILGKVIVDIPYLGFILDFARQPAGFALLIGVPALLIIIDELDNIWREVRRVRRMKITKEMIMPLVIAPYQPNLGSSIITNVSELELNKKAVLVQARMMDIKPLAKKIDSKPSLQLKSRLPVLTTAHDVKSRLTVATAGLVMMVTLAGQVNVGDSWSYFSDTEASAINNLGAQSLDFSLSQESADFSIVDGVFVGGNSLELGINDGGKDLRYQLSVAFASGTTAFCDTILVDADASLSYSGFLPSLTGSNLSFTNPLALNFSLDKDSDYVSGDFCKVNLIFIGYANNLEGEGYVDTEMLSLNFVATKNPVLVPEAINLGPVSGETLIGVEETNSSSSLKIPEIAETPISEVNPIPDEPAANTNGVNSDKAKSEAFLPEEVMETLPTNIADTPKSEE